MRASVGALIAFTLVLLAPAWADAQTIELAVDERAHALIDVEAIATALGTELATPVEVVSFDARRGETRITVRARGPRRVSLELVAGGRSPLRRSTRLTADREDRTATIVILAANMVRDEAGEIVAMLRRRRESVAAVEGLEGAGEGEGAGEVEVEGERAVEGARVESATATGETATGESESDTATASATSESESETATGESATPIAESAPVEPFIRVGVNGQFAGVPRGTELELAYIAGIEVAATPLPFFAIGLRDLGGGYATNQRWNVGGAPFVELAWRFADFGDLHGGLGAHIQYLDGGVLAPDVGVAPLVYVGARFYLVPLFSISIESALRVVATNAFHTGLSVIPQGAVLWTGGLSFTFHLPN